MAAKKETVTDTSPLTFPGDLSFIKKASAAGAALGFMRRAEGFIRATYPDAILILNDALAGKGMPTPSLNQIRQIAFAHYNAEQVKKADKSLAKHLARENGTSGAGNYSAQFFVTSTDERTGKQTIQLFQDDKGNTTFLFGTYGEAEHVIDRKQSENPQASYAVIRNTCGKEIQTTLTRDDSLARVNRKKAGAVCQKKASGESKPFKNYCSGHQTRVSFSRG